MAGAPMNPTLKKAYWTLVGLGAFYVFCVSLLLNEKIQRLYVDQKELAVPA
jgi:hypothetical protein